VILNSGPEGALTFRNARGAKLIGIELEARRNLGAFAAALSDFSLVANLTVAHSRIELPKVEANSLTTLSRPLVNQAPWVFNASVDYSREDVGVSGRLLYNVVGPRIAQVGAGGLSDVYEHPRGVLDFTLQKKLGEHLNLKFEARNLLNSEVLQTQGCGGDGLFGSTWHFSCSNGTDQAVSRYTEGVSLALAAGYDF
jgi:outer membrane receptor protein involved in Fe transport